MEPADPRRWSVDDARAHPLWDSPVFTAPRKFIKLWKRLEAHTVGDIAKQSGANFSGDEMMSYETMCKRSDEMKSG